MIRWAKCRHNFLFQVTVLVPALAIFTFGQVPTGSLGGTVLDESEAVIPDAKVTVTNQDTAFQRLVTSGKDGMFLVPGLPAGPYEVRAEAKGFRTLFRPRRSGLETAVESNCSFRLGCFSSLSRRSTEFRRSTMTSMASPVSCHDSRSRTCR